MDKTDTISLNTGGFTDVIDITDKVVSIVTHSRIRDGLVIAFCSGSTGSIATIEYEAGVIHDLEKAIGKIVPSDIAYKHDKRWGTVMVFLSCYPTSLLDIRTHVDIRAKFELNPI